MKSMHVLLTGAMLGSAGCLALGLGFPRAEAQEGGSADAKSLASWSEVALELSQTRSRQAVPPFELVRRTDADADLGRLTFVLEGTLPPSGGRIFLPQPGEAVDVHTVMIRADGADGYFGIFHDFDPDNVASWFFNIKALVFYTPSEDSKVIHFNPPVRFREGDVILANIQGSSASSAFFMVHGTIVSESVIDQLRVE